MNFKELFKAYLIGFFISWIALAGMANAALLLALNETLRELRIEEENDLARAPTLRTGRAIKRARLDVYARIGIICHPVIARLATDKGDTINAAP